MTLRDYWWEFVLKLVHFAVFLSYVAVLGGTIFGVWLLLAVAVDIIVSNAEVSYAIPVWGLGGSLVLHGSAWLLLNVLQGMAETARLRRMK